MAIYSLNHRSIGKSTHSPGTAGAHIAYIVRKNAAGAVLAERMPQERHEARAWIDRAEANDRKNGRVCDKVMAALPRELDTEQRMELARRFGHEATQGRGSWLAAIHDKGRDEGNPHAHFVIRDKDAETGKRVAELSEKGSTERLRELWEGLANEALEQAGHDARIDRRTLEAQGIERKPQIHVGPKAKAMQERGVEPVSKSRHDRRGRWIQYFWIDFDVVKRRGRTRAEHNALIVRRNERDAERRRRREAWQARERAEREAEERKAREDRARDAKELEAIRESCGIKPARTQPALEAREAAPAEFSGGVEPKSDEKNGNRETGVTENRDKRDGEAPTQEMGREVSAEAQRAQDSKKTALAGISPQEEFSAACLRNGLVIEGGPIMDGEWHTVPVAGDGVGEAKGMYRGCLAGEPSGTIANLRDGNTVRAGCMHMIDPNKELRRAPEKVSGSIVIAEGYATAASVHEATGRPVACAFDAHNLRPVAEALRRKYPDAKIVIASDDDRAKGCTVSLVNAADTAKAVGGTFVAPRFTEAEKAKGMTDYNDLARSRGRGAVREELAPVSGLTLFDGF